MKKIITFIMLLQLVAAHSQKQDNIWYFGYNAGLDFNSGAPVPLSDGMISTDEGVSTLCDVNGNLLFYTDGVVVYNKNHQIMQFGIGLLGDISSAQSAIIIPKPGSSTTYYIFTTDATYESFNPPSSGVNYSEVDITANNGLGAVVNKNINLISESSEHLTATYHQNGKDIWVIAHGYDDNLFHSFLVTEAGVTSSVISSAGPALPSEWPHDGGRGIMKISPQGNKLAFTHSTFGVMPGEEPIPSVQLFTFSNATGVVSNSQVLSYIIMAYGVEFSANGKMLYISSESSQTNRLVQYNLEAEDIAASEIKIIEDSSELPIWGGGALQMAVDGKIYFAVALRNTISVINNPDGLGLNCDFQSDSVSLGSGTSYIGLPFRMAVANPEIQAENICIDQSASFSIQWSTDAVSIDWDFGDGNTSNHNNPVHVYNEPGTYTITATILGQGRTWLVKKEITVNPMETLLINEMCVDNIHMLGVDAENSSFDITTATITWIGPEGFTASTAVIVTPVPGDYLVTVTPANGCPSSSIYKVDSIECFIPRGISPNGDGLNDNFDLTGFNIIKLQIFNRYGIRVYNANNYTSQWYGQSKNNDKLPTGTYYYIAELASGKNKSGWVYINY